MSRVVLLDVEGTTTPISFVVSVLFPYARERLSAYVKEHWDELRSVAAAADVDTPGDLAQSAAAAMDGDRKVGWLKELQGLIWEKGYRDGELRGQVFADVPPRLEHWFAHNVPVCIYSSGSVLAQKLLFSHSEAGDLSRWLTAYFDTGVGAKASPDSYRQIEQQLGARGLFLTDVVAEAQAASEAEWEVMILDRPGNLPQPAHPFRVVSDFSAIN